MVNERIFNLIVVDSALADGDGYEFIHWLRRSDVVRRHLASNRYLRHSILVAHVCDNRRVSSVFLASRLLDKPDISVRTCIPGAKHSSKKRAVVGREASTSSLAFR